MQKDIASHVCQFFTTIDGEVAFPIQFAGHRDEHGKFLTDHIRQIKEQLDRVTVDDYKLQIVGGCSDGLSGNLTFAETQKIVDLYLHFFDMSHQLKRMRNRLLNETLHIDDVNNILLETNVLLNI